MNVTKLATFVLLAAMLSSCNGMIKAGYVLEAAWEAPQQQEKVEV